MILEDFPQPLWRILQDHEWSRELGGRHELAEQGLCVGGFVVAQDDDARSRAGQPDGQRLVTGVVTRVQVGGVPGDTAEVMAVSVAVERGPAVSGALAVR